MFQLTPLSQNDPAWKDKLLGTSSQTIGRYGCLLTSLVMVVNYFGENETPDTLNTLMVEAGQFTGSDIIPARIPHVLPNIRFVKFARYFSYAQTGEIDATLAADKPVICEVDHSPVAGLQSHWIVVYAKVGNDYAIYDPWPWPIDGGQVLLRQRYGFAGSAAEIIRGAIWMEKVV